MDNMHKQVDFVIAGQPKSGTTALAQFLENHPDICISHPKEPGYFATDFMKESDDFHGTSKYFAVRTAEDYDRCFTHCKPDQIRGEATTDYAYSKTAAQNIYNHNPSAKIIVMLRNPVDFIHSLHMQLVNATLEDEKDFNKALKLEDDRKNGKNIPSRARFPANHFYIDRGKYYEQLKKFFDIFPAENILIPTNEEFKQDNAATFNKILRFLEVDTSFTPNFEIIKGSQAPRFETLNRIVHTPWIKRTLYKILPPSVYVKIPQIVHKIVLKDKPRQLMEPELRQELEHTFLPDVQKTSKLLGRDLVNEWGLDK